MVCIIKKDGTKEEFNVQKIVSAVNKSASRIMYEFSNEEIEFLCEYAKKKVEDRKKMRFPFRICIILWKVHLSR